MIYKLKHSQWLEDLNLFMENFPEKPALPLEYFHPVQLPIVITEAKVKMRTVQDYSVLSLLILRLFDAGITSPEVIHNISSMSLETIKTYIQKEKLVLDHIDPKTDRLTELGRMTIEANQQANGETPKSCQYFDSVIRVHIEPLTASLVPQYLEWERGDNIQPNQDAGDFILPPESAEVDESFRQVLNTRLLDDINNRMEEHVSCDAVKNGNVLSTITGFDPIRIFYRWGYLAKFQGMAFPLLVLSGRKNVNTLNSQSIAEDKHKERVMLPVAIGESDCAYLKLFGMEFDGVLARDNDCFIELAIMAGKMNLTLPSEEDEDDDDAPVAEEDEESLVEEPPVEANEDEQDPEDLDEPQQQLPVVQNPVAQKTVVRKPVKHDLPEDPRDIVLDTFDDSDFEDFDDFDDEEDDYDYEDEEEDDYDYGDEEEDDYDDEDEEEDDYDDEGEEEDDFDYEGEEDDDYDYDDEEDDYDYDEEDDYDDEDDFDDYDDYDDEEDGL